MYLHLGNQTIVRTGNILMILDMDNATVSHITRAYLAAADRQKRVTAATEEVPKSMVIMADGTIYLSQLSSAVLKKRAGELFDL